MMNRLRLWWMRRGLLMLAVGTCLTACSTDPKVPPQAPPAVEVKVPVAVPCIPVQVPAPNRPKGLKGMGIFDLTKTVLADRLILVGDNVRLRAANANPCPTNGATK